MSAKKKCCCGESPFACGTICSRTSEWWPGGLSARLQASFSGVTISTSLTGPSVATVSFWAYDGTFPSVFGTPGWQLLGATASVAGDAKRWLYPSGAALPAGHYDGAFGCCEDFEPLDATQVCVQAAAIENMGHSWVGAGAVFGSEDAGVTATYACQTRADMGSCPVLSWTNNTFQSPPYAYPVLFASVTSISSFANHSLTGGTRATCAVSYPTVLGVKKIRIEGYTSVAIKVVGPSGQVFVDSCGNNYPTSQPAYSLGDYVYWFFHEGDPPEGFPCSQSTWTFDNQLTVGYTPSNSSAKWGINPDCDGANINTTCNTPWGGVFNIGSGGSVTLSLTNDGCHDGPDLLSIDIHCNDAESSPATWDGPMQLVGELDIGTGDPYYEGETTLYTGSATWTGTGWDYRIVRKSDSAEMFNNVVVSGDIDDPTGTYDYDGSLWDEECGTLLQLVATEVP